MNRYVSIKKNQEFKKIYGIGKSYANKYLVMYVLKNDFGYSRFGISVSKKVGNSVKRHKVTRRLREIGRLNLDNISSKYDIIVIARTGILDVNYYTLEKAYIHLLKLHKIYIN